GRVGHLVMQGVAAAERVFELLDTPNEVADAPDARPCGPLQEAFAFENVTFRYPPRGDAPPPGSAPTRAERPTLDAFSLTIRRGEVVALVGASGSGKSTVANLVPRFYDPTDGRVTWD